MTDPDITLYLSPWYRRSPYFQAARRHGVRSYFMYNHMLSPGNFEDEVSEYWQLVNDVAVWDVAVERQVEITGPDAFAFTNLLTPRDLTKCPVGQGRYVVLTAEDGGIINDPVLLRLGENHFWLSLSDSDALLWAKGVAVHSGMDVDIREPDVSPMQVQGPKSKNAVKALVGPKAMDLGYYEFLETEIAGIPVVVTRTGWTAEVGYEIYLRDGHRGDELWERVMEAGKLYNLKPAGPSEIRRIEAGILNYQSDMTLETNPYEVGLDRLVDLDKRDDFIGKAALRRIRSVGVKRKLVGFEMEGAPFEDWFMDYWPVRSDGRPIGKVTAFTHSPRLKKNIGYAMVPIEHARIGIRLTIVTPSGERTATVVRKPFIDPEKQIPRT